MDNIAIIVGAGFGKRFGSFKQTEPIYGKAVYKYSLDAFISAGIFSKIYLVLHSELIKTIKMEIENSKYKKTKLNWWCYSSYLWIKKFKKKIKKFFKKKKRK